MGSTYDVLLKHMMHLRPTTVAVTTLSIVLTLPSFNFLVRIADSITILAFHELR